MHDDNPNNKGREREGPVGIGCLWDSGRAEMLAPLYWRLSMHQTEKGRVHVMLWRDPSWPDLKLDARNEPVRILEVSWKQTIGKLY